MISFVKSFFNLHAKFLKFVKYKENEDMIIATSTFSKRNFELSPYSCVSVEDSQLYYLIVALELSFSLTYCLICWTSSFQL